jgi:hypothetical protein
MNWTHNKEVINQWNAIIYGLTNRVVRILGGDSHGTEMVELQLKTKVIKFDIPKKFVLQSWHRMICKYNNLMTRYHV